MMDTMYGADAQTEHVSEIDVLDFMRAVTYKDWSIYLSREDSIRLSHHHGTPLLAYIISYVAPDTRQPGLTKVTAHMILWPPAFRNVDELQAFVMGELGRMDLHECREHFKVHGTRPYDPHTDEGQAEWARHVATFRHLLVWEGLPEAADGGQYYYGNTEYLRAA